MYPKTPTFDVALKSTERQWVQKIPEVYTNDLNSVSIQFKITDCTDTELTGSTAIVLLKMRDGSFFQVPSVDVTRTLNVFSYTLKENEGNHDGLAEIQLIVTIDAKEFATQKYNFKVISGLDSDVAREIMIYDWSTLTAEARAYIDQFTADEVLRDAEFDNSQFDRNVAFNLAQNNRQSQFSDLAEDLTATLDATLQEMGAHKASTDNPHGVTKTQVGLGNVDNTSDANKPVSTAQQTALNLKANKVQEAWITPTLLNGWTTSSIYGSIRYNMDDMGYVHIEGSLIGTNAIGLIAFVLPNKYMALMNYPVFVCNGVTTATDIVIVSPDMVNGDFSITSKKSCYINIVYKGRG